MAVRKRTNTFTLTVNDGRAPGDRVTVSGKLRRNGDLDLLLNGHSFVTLPGNLIPALAHWLSGVNGRYADVDPTKLQTSAPVLPIRRN